MQSCCLQSNMFSSPKTTFLLQVFQSIITFFFPYLFSNSHCYIIFQIQFSFTFPFIVFLWGQAVGSGYVVCHHLWPSLAHSFSVKSHPTRLPPTFLLFSFPSLPFEKQMSYVLSPLSCQLQVFSFGELGIHPRVSQVFAIEPYFQPTTSFFFFYFNVNNFAVCINTVQKSFDY